MLGIFRTLVLLTAKQRTKNYPKCAENGRANTKKRKCPGGKTDETKKLKMKKMYQTENSTPVQRNDVICFLPEASQRAASPQKGPRAQK